jgi:hypothetical protein
VTHKCCEVVVYGLALVMNDYQAPNTTHTHTSTHKNKFVNNGLLNTAAQDSSTIYSRHWIKDYGNSEFNSAADINPDPLSQIHLP